DLPRLICDDFTNNSNIIEEFNDIIYNLTNDINLSIKNKDLYKLLGYNFPELNFIYYSYFGNYYRNGNDYTPFHTDQYNSHVISISLGETRTFVFKNNIDNSSVKFNLDNGDILIFLKNVNDKFKHSIIREPSIDGERINITCFLKI